MISQTEYSIIIVDDEPSVHSSVKRCLRNEPYSLTSALSGNEALVLLRNNHFHLAVIDLKMPLMDGIALMRLMKKKQLRIPVLILSGTSIIQEAVEAVQAGALDFIEKPFHTESFRNRIRQTYNYWLLKEENERLHHLNSKTGFYKDFVGISSPMLELKELISRAAPSDEAVLIEGETGTGKGLVAKSVHAQSLRADKPFLTIDCSGISETLIDSELFGHEKGSFTGAAVPHSGLFRTADGGTVFLDEIGELSIGLQSKLLRVLQEKKIRPVGSVEDRSVDIRIIAATNRDLPGLIRSGSFREDLYYRLNVISIPTIPLRERKEDIPILCRFFLKKFRSDISPVDSISPEALQIMEQYSWPGNVRELENFLRRTVAIGTGSVIQPEDLPDSFGKSTEDSGSAGEEAPPIDYSLETAELKAIIRALKKTESNRAGAAELLGISEATLYRKIKLYGL